MGISKYLTALGALLLGSFSLNANAQTPACSWKSVYGYGSGGSSYTVWNCSSSTNVLIAWRIDSFTYMGPGSPTEPSCGARTIISGYKSIGTEGSVYPLKCNSIIVAE